MRIATLFVASLCATACGSPTGTDPGGGDDGMAGVDAGPGDTVRPRLRDCRGRAFAPAPAAPWRHDYISPVVIATGAANHYAKDQIVTSAPNAQLTATFIYGLLAVDLEDEDVRVSIDNCSAWVTVGDFRTDSDGMIHATLPSDLDIGVYEVRFQVLGDRSTTSSTLWVLPTGTHFVIADIDGTLSQSDTELFKQILDGSYVPAPYASAVDLTTRHHDDDQIVLYLTGRPGWLTQRTRDWVTGRGFADGPVRVTDSLTEILPLEGSVGTFKKRVVTSLIEAGYVIDTAYGNASTDIYAYLGAGVPADDVWIIGAHAGEYSTQPAATWTARAAEVAALPAVVQPFAR